MTRRFAWSILVTALLTLVAGAAPLLNSAAAAEHWPSIHLGAGPVAEHWPS
jgi:hypothetical protein